MAEASQVTALAGSSWATVSMACSQPTADHDENSYSTDPSSEEEVDDEDSMFVANTRAPFDKFVFSYNTENDRAESMTAAEDKLYNLDSRAFIERGKIIGTEITRILTDSNDLSEKAKEQLAVLFREAANLAEFEQKSEVKICFLGDQGAGKSSIINSILNCSKLAPTGNCGSSITSVPTEYRRCRKGDTALLTMEVDHLTRDEMIDKISSALTDFRCLYLPENKNVEDESIKEASEMGFDVLKSLFSHQHRFSKAFLRNMEADGEGIIQDELLSWFDDIVWPDGWDVDSRVWQTTASYPNEYQAFMQQLHNSGLWVFTNIIRVYRDAQILKNGIVLVDVPGLRDTNSSKVKMTEDYVFKSQFLFVVVPIGRSITAETVRSSLTTSLSKNVSLSIDRVARYLNVGVICTHSDEIDIQEAIDELFPKKGPNAKRSKKKSEVNRLWKEVKQSKKEKNWSKMHEAKATLQRMLIQERAERVENGLKEAYAADVPGDFSVFCVDNKSYKTGAMKGGKAIEDVRSSGIPKLRLFFHRMSIQAQISELYSLASRLEELVNSLLLWNDPSKRDMTHELFESKLKEMKRALGASIDEQRSFSVDNLADELSSLLSDKSLTLSFEEAKEKADLWGLEYKASQYNAWVIKDGNHRTKGRGAANWNAELATPLQQDLDRPLAHLVQEVKKSEDIVLRDALVHFKDLASFAAKLDLPQELRDNISLKVSSAEREFAHRKMKLDDEIKDIRMKALEGLNGGFMQQEIMGAYKAASAERGRGKFNRQKNEIQKAITLDIFKNVGNRLRLGMTKAAESGFDDHHKDLGHTIDQINADLERCTVKLDVKLEPELEEYRARIAQDLEPLKKQIESLGKHLPIEKVEPVKEKGKRAAAVVKNLKEEGIAKKRQTWIGAGGQHFARAQ
ncbi:hypothetical protein FKW77_000678 [Venturia effusa]|uniref:G domain-containing protein n=1 Tax=Venturia effusa TaxID=50376 RepID=A0A517L4U3_9PEZI|nr:hypothetical protein FKW77_000678 [Venturia effusa]